MNPEKLKKSILKEVELFIDKTMSEVSALMLELTSLKTVVENEKLKVVDLKVEQSRIKDEISRDSKRISSERNELDKQFKLFVERREKSDSDLLLASNDMKKILEIRDALKAEIGSMESMKSEFSSIRKGIKLANEELSGLEGLIVSKRKELEQILVVAEKELREKEDAKKELETEIKKLNDIKEAFVNEYRPSLEDMNEREITIKKKENDLAIIEKRFRKFAEEHNIGFKL